MEVFYIYSQPHLFLFIKTLIQSTLVLHYQPFLYRWLILYMGNIEQPVPDTPDDPIMAIEHQCQLYCLTDLERLRLADLIASQLYDPDSPPLNINQAIQTIIDQREESPEED